MTKTERKRLEAALNHLKKCDGNCIHANTVVHIASAIAIIYFLLLFALMAF